MSQWDDMWVTEEESLHLRVSFWDTFFVRYSCSMHPFLSLFCLDVRTFRRRRHTKQAGTRWELLARLWQSHNLWQSGILFPDRDQQIYTIKKARKEYLFILGHFIRPNCKPCFFASNSRFIILRKIKRQERVVLRFHGPQDCTIQTWILNLFVVSYELSDTLYKGKNITSTGRSPGRSENLNKSYWFAQMSASGSIG